MKNNQKKVSFKKNYLYQMIFQVLAILLPLITAPYISRTLGVDAIGVQSLTYNISNYFVVFSMLGLATYGNRAIAKAKENQDNLNKVFSELFYIHLLLSIVAVVVYYLVIYFFVEKNKEIYLISGIYVIFCAFDINWLFFGLEEFKLSVTRSIFIKIIATISILVFIKSLDDLWLYVFILSASTALSYIIVWPFIKGRVTFVKTSVFKAFKNHFIGLIVLFIPTLANSLYRSLSKLMIGVISSTEQLGFFENSEKIITLLIGIISALGVVLLPRISNLYEKREDEAIIKKISEDTIFINSFLTYALFFGIAGISTQFAPIFFGVDFTYSGKLLMVFSLTIPFLSLSNLIRMIYFIPLNKDKYYVISIVVGALVNIILNLVLVKYFSAMGAVISILVTEFIVMILHLHFSRKFFDFKLIAKTNLPFIVIGFIMFIVVYIFGLNVVGNNLLLMLVQIGIGAILYVLLCLCYFALFKKELLIKMKSKFRSRSKNKIS